MIHMTCRPLRLFSDSFRCLLLQNDFLLEFGLHFEFGSFQLNQVQVVKFELVRLPFLIFLIFKFELEHYAHGFIVGDVDLMGAVA